MSDEALTEGPSWDKVSAMIDAERRRRLSELRSPSHLQTVEVRHEVAEQIVAQVLATHPRLGVLLGEMVQAGVLKLSTKNI